ncbi:MAG TPA: hypothetical protein PK199_10830, partial [Bacteroidales bacterium]|nr:hypothetical protein [Bacteroidales bacterium]
MNHISLVSNKEYKIFIQSLLSFLTVFFLVKLVLIFIRFITINYFNGGYDLIHFELICTNHPHS